MSLRHDPCARVGHLRLQQGPDKKSILLHLDRRDEVRRPADVLSRLQIYRNQVRAITPVDLATVQTPVNSPLDSPRDSAYLGYARGIAQELDSGLVLIQNVFV